MSTEYPYTYIAENIVQTGAAREGRTGVPNDPVTITISEVTYKFKVVLPAIGRHLGNLSVSIFPNGDVEVGGIVKAGEITNSAAPIVCNRRTRRILPQAHFTINFSLPGPVDHEFVLVKIHPNGGLEGSVLKRPISSSDDQPESSN